MSALVIPKRCPVVTHELNDPDQTVLFDRSDRTLLVLNDVGAVIWYLIDGKRAVCDIVGLLCENFGASKETVLADTNTFLVSLEKRGLVLLEQK